MVKENKEKLKHVSSYNTLEAAEIMGVKDQTIRNWCKKGKYPDAVALGSGVGEFQRVTLELLLNRPGSGVRLKKN